MKVDLRGRYCLGVNTCRDVDDQNEKGEIEREERVEREV